MPSVHCARINIRIASASTHYLPLRPVVCVLVRCRRRRCQLHDPKTCSRRASRRRAWRRRCSRRHVPLALRGRRVLHRFVCCWLCLCVHVGTAPSSSCTSLFVSLSLRRSRLGSRAVCNRQRRESIALLFPLVLSPTARLSPRHPVHRQPAIVLVPFGTPPEHGTLVFLFVKERAADSGGAERINRIFPVTRVHYNGNPGERRPSKWIWPADDLHRRPPRNGLA